MKDKKIILFNNTDLASRSVARVKRQEVEPLILAGETLVFDCSKVESISGSYADELFGVLALQFGEETLLSKIKLRNCKEHCLEVIAESIMKRSAQKTSSAA